VTSAHDPRAGPDWEKMEGLLPCVTTDAVTGEVLTVAYVNEEALNLARDTGVMHYWSRSRNRIWKKGEESGHVQEIVSLALDCDGDAVLARVTPKGPACHEGTRSCFTVNVQGHHRPPPLTDLQDVLLDRAQNPKPGSHTTALLTDENLRLKKIAEESGEVLMAAKDKDPASLKSEIADLVYHALVAGVAAGVTPRDVLEELAARRK
jgi:phosphoribosyl-AMP cyclohydrolase / phosphoribosyl-ATP pyrophosphohydrolase